MLRRGFRARHWLSALSVVALVITTFSPISLSPATAAPALVTCVNLQLGTERISHTGKCRYTQEAQANWHKNQSDSPIASGPTAKVIVICSNKESSPVSYQVIRKKCARHQVTTVLSRSGSLPSKPVIAEAVSYGHDSASLKLAIDPATSADAPIVFYTVTVRNVDTSTATKIESKRIYSWKDLGLIVGGLQGRTTYTFTVTATTVDGTSAISISSIPVTTPVYVPPASNSSSNSSTVAAPAFNISSSAEVKTVNNAITGYTITSTGGTIASYSISPAAPAGTTFNTSTGLLSGTPTATQTATAYTITATNASGSATRTFTLTVQAALSAPVFSLSKTAETTTAFTAPVGFGYSIDASAGGAVASYALTGTLPAGLNFSTSTGLITGSPTETKTATTYTITATNAAGSSAATYRLRVTGDIGDDGPGGGKIFYRNVAGFACGPTRALTCTYLEAAPSGWNVGGDPLRRWANDTYKNTVVNNATSPETATANGIGWGYRNTLAIILQGNSDTTFSAAALADAYSATVSGLVYDDWYLPSKDELNQMCKWQRGVAWTSDATVCSGGSLNSGTGAAGFVANYYWPSSENSELTVKAQSFDTGSQIGVAKETAVRVRPIRAF